jgi:hypothetical protein
MIIIRRRLRMIKQLFVCSKPLDDNGPCIASDRELEMENKNKQNTLKKQNMVLEIYVICLQRTLANAVCGPNTGEICAQQLGSIGSYMGLRKWARSNCQVQCQIQCPI